MSEKLFAPLGSLAWIDHDSLDPNDYNPNKVSRENLRLLTRSIIVNGFTLPIVVRPSMTIIDGFHRWTVTGSEWDFVPSFTDKEVAELGISPSILNRTLHDILGGKVPIVVVEHKNEAGYMYGTITHNRARGTHLLEPMKAIVRRLMSDGKGIDEIGKQLGMRPEEIFRLSDFSREDFLSLMADGQQEYSKAEFLART